VTINERKVYGRTRRENSSEVRDKRVSVYLTDKEHRQLMARAGDLGVTIPRLLLEMTAAPDRATNTEFKVALAELFAVSRRIAQISLDFRKLAEIATESGDFPEEAVLASLECRAAIFSIHEVVRKLGKA
jgi:hypothetical protein